MICIKCGKEVNETDKFCENCGHDLAKKSFIEFMKYKKYIISIFIVIVVLLVGFLGYQYYDSHKKLINPYRKYFAQIGVQYTQKDNNIVITDFINDSPADKSSLQKNDIILKVNNKTVNGLTLDEISNLIQGQVGKKVKLQVKRGDKIHNISIIRDNIGEYFEYRKGVYLNTKYLKYENGKYDYWTRTVPSQGKVDLTMHIVMDIKNQKFGYLKMDVYNSKGEFIENIINSDEKIKMYDIEPNTPIYTDYKFIKRIDDNSSNREKEQFKGFLE